MESMVLTASEAELLKGNANLIELLPGSDDSTLCEGSSQQHLPLTYKRLKHFVYVTSIYRLCYRSRIVIMLLLPNGPE